VGEDVRPREISTQKPESCGAKLGSCVRKLAAVWTLWIDLCIKKLKNSVFQKSAILRSTLRSHNSYADRIVTAESGSVKVNFEVNYAANYAIA